jgi:hypothetical protein
METAAILSLLVQLQTLVAYNNMMDKQAREEEKQLRALAISEVAAAGKFLRACKRAEDHGYQFPKALCP